MADTPRLPELAEAAPNSPLFWRFPAVASMLGVATDTLLSDCEAGRVPIRVSRFGARQLPYAHSGDTLDFLRSLPRKGPTK